MVHVQKFLLYLQRLETPRTNPYFRDVRCAEGETRGNKKKNLAKNSEFQTIRQLFDKRVLKKSYDNFFKYTSY